MKDKEIFTITTLREHMADGNRCIGFYFDLYKAMGAVLKNDGDMYEEGYYPYCVIEGVKPGLYFLSRSEYWFKWNIDKHEYEKLSKKPDKYSMRVCFGIG
jgi:hypothetical protein